CLISASARGHECPADAASIIVKAVHGDARCHGTALASHWLPHRGISFACFLGVTLMNDWVSDWVSASQDLRFGAGQPEAHRRPGASKKHRDPGRFLVRGQRSIELVQISATRWRE